MHYWVDLQSIHGFCCYDKREPHILAIGAHDSIAVNTKCSMPVFFCLWFCAVDLSSFQFVLSFSFPVVIVDLKVLETKY